MIEQERKFRSSCRHRHAWLAASAMASLCPSVVHAQIASAQEAQEASSPSGREDDVTQEEIIVTANRRAENLQDVPISISVITGESLEAAGIDSSEDLAIKTPGLIVNSTGTGFRPFIRGIGTSSVAVGNENSVSVYIDDVYILNNQGGLQSLNSISQVEVLKGPQGTLFGRNATGGVVNIKTLEPADEVKMRFGLTYANYETVIAHGYLSVPITNTVSANIASYYSHQGKGWGTNLITGNEVYRTPLNFSVRAKLKFEPTENTSFLLSGDYQELRSSGLMAQKQLPGTVHGYGVGETTAGQRPDLAPFVAAGAIRPFTIVGDPNVYRGGQYDITHAVDPSTDQHQEGVSLRAIQNLDFAELVSISAYRTSRSTSFISGGAGAGPRSLPYIEFLDRYFTQELRLGSAADSRVKWLVGGYFLAAKSGFDPFRLTGTTLAPLSALVINSRQRTRSYAGFAQVTIPLADDDSTNLTAGGRYTRENKRLSGTVSGVLPNGATIPLGPPAADRSGVSKFNYRVALDHKFGDNVLGYISYTTGFKSGVYNLAPPQAPPTEPEELKSIEAGLKVQALDRRLTVNTSAFYYDYSNLQVTVFNGITNSTQNAAGAELYGLDLDAQLEVDDRLKLSGGLSLLHSRFTSYAQAQFNVPKPLSAGGGNAVFSGDAKGKELPYAPSFTISAAADYRIPLNSGAEIGLNATYYHNRGYFTSPDNIDVLRINSYNILNIRSDYKFSDERTKISLWAQNLLGDYYFTQKSSGGDPGGFFAGVPAAPRTYGITLDYSF